MAVSAVVSLAPLVARLDRVARLPAGWGSSGGRSPAPARLGMHIVGVRRTLRDQPESIEPAFAVAFRIAVPNDNDISWCGG